jgi:adenosylcobinamide-phosphate synthase/adenosylcobinamide-GDP ribazoletransferase
MSGSVKEWLQAAAAALQFLTRFPVRWRVPYDEPTLARSVVMYPTAGLAVGLALAAAGTAASWLLPPLPAAVVVTAVWAAVTGGLHLDGLMDTADGLLSYRSRDRMLEIMKDSRVGAMGVIAGVLQLGLKASLLTPWTAAASPAAWLPLLTVPVWSRAFLAAAIAGWPYARAEGLGALLRGVRLRHAAGAAGAAAALAALVLAAELRSGTAPSGAVLQLAAMAAVTYGGGAWLAARIARKLGGLTGDTYGALNEALETALLLVLAAGIHIHLW